MPEPEAPDVENFDRVQKLTKNLPPLLPQGRAALDAEHYLTTLQA